MVGASIYAASDDIQQQLVISVNISDPKSD